MTTAEYARVGDKPDKCVPAADLATQRKVQLSAEEKSLLTHICIPFDKRHFVLQKANATAFQGKVVHDGIPGNVTCEETLWCDRANICSRVCKRGTVQQDAWLKSITDFQWRLARKQPFCYAQLPGSHNSGISLADGYGNRDAAFQVYLDSISWLTGGGKLSTNNQWLSLTDQLNLGVRNIELDSHWVAGELRIAHCGGLHLSQLNMLVRELNLVAKLLGHPIRWDTETMGCQPSLSSVPATDQRTVKDAFLEIRDWLQQPEHKDEFLVLFFDDQKDLKTWKKVPLLLDIVREVFGQQVVLTPAEVKGWGINWPSIDQLSAAGKQLLLVSGVDYGEDMSDVIFAKNGVCGWFEPHLKDFTGPSTCQVEAEDTGAGRLSRVLSCEITYGPLNCQFIMGDPGLVLDKYTLPDVSACSVNMPCPDRITPTRMEYQVWSWAKGHPHTAAGRSGFGCSTVSSEDGRWRVVECGGEHPTACRQPDSRLDPNTTRVFQKQWRLVWGPYGKCPEGYAFEIPQTGRENVSLMALLRARRAASAWLPLRAPDFLPPSWKSPVARGPAAL